MPSVGTHLDSQIVGAVAAALATFDHGGVDEPAERGWKHVVVDAKLDVIRTKDTVSISPPTSDESRSFG